MTTWLRAQLRVQSANSIGEEMETIAASRKIENVLETSQKENEDLTNVRVDYIHQLYWFTKIITQQNCLKKNC